MSSILNTIKNTIASSIKVEVKSPTNRNGKTRYPVLVTDMGASFTSGWFIQYNPVSQDNGTRLYDGSETFSELHISNFSELHNMILTANYYFLQGAAVENLSEGRKRAIYEPSPAVRLTVTSQPNSVSVVVTVTDEASPFHMMSIPFTVVLSKDNSGNYYVVGTDNDRWDRNTDTFKEFNANFAPRKGRFYRVHQQQNQPATLRAKIAVNNGQYQINQDGTFAVDTNASSPEYIQVISNEFKALAYIYEQALMSKAFEMALAQGLPTTQQATGQPTATPNFNGGFVPAFNIGNAGAPNPVITQQPQVPTQAQIPLSNEVPAQGVQAQQPATPQFGVPTPNVQPMTPSFTAQAPVMPTGTEQPVQTQNNESPVAVSFPNASTPLSASDLPWVKS
ncbi:hypothetical protein C2I27_03820 [Priestia megaterium]|uniref:hypothetical protein n=1 Tax=Priestia megaterium TaxID=1404 RepID=UPI000D50E011|nr:hypothetical protein [Priestia megaterium]PVC75024.1 hypothetical protein C2I27_03820 [Priestia megaterium]